MKGGFKAFLMRQSNQVEGSQAQNSGIYRKEGKLYQKINGEECRIVKDVTELQENQRLKKAFSSAINNTNTDSKLEILNDIFGSQSQESKSDFGMFNGTTGVQGDLINFGVPNNGVVVLGNPFGENGFDSPDF